MTLSELSRIYNFHDCDVFIPFDVNQDSITVTFDLAKHMQYGELKARYSECIKNADFHLLATVKFSNCSNVRASEWIFDYTAEGKPKRISERSIAASNIDREMFLYTVSISNEDGVYLLFTREPEKGSELTFMCENAEIIEEKLVSQEEYNKICELFSKQS